MEYYFHTTYFHTTTLHTTHTVCIEYGHFTGHIKNICMHINYNMATLQAISKIYVLAYIILAEDLYMYI